MNESGSKISEVGDTRKYLILDPGRSTGFASFNEKGRCRSLGIARGLDGLMESLEELGPHEVVVYEDFQLFSRKAVQQSGSRMEASQAIGIIKAFARKWESELHHERPGTHKVGQLWGGMPEKGKHDDNHDITAFNLGIYYLMKHGVIKKSHGRTIVNLSKTSSEDDE